jgi:hypothetical protein
LSAPKHYIVEYLGEDGAWCRKSYHQGLDKAEIMAEVTHEAGYKTRILHDGKIVQESGE